MAAVRARDPRASTRRSTGDGGGRRLRPRPLEHRDGARLPEDTVEGIDSDRASFERARQNLEGSGVEDRVTFHERNAADAELAGRYDLVTIFEALHDMSYPVDVLRAARALLAEGGVVLVGDERTDRVVWSAGGRP